MAIDENPIEALQKQFALEDSSKSPVTEAVLKAAAELAKLGKIVGPLAAVIEACLACIANDGRERIRVMLDIIAEQVIKHDADIKTIKQTLSTEEQQTRNQRLAALVIEGARRAYVTRSIERVQRIGLILAHAMYQRSLDDDGIEEMMRVASELGESDLAALGELVRIEGEMLRRASHIERYTAHSQWERGSWGTRVDPEIESAFHKLESYGLVSAIAPPNNLNITADIGTRFVLLPKGLRFTELTS
jgi:hypothetical protein